MKFVELVKKYGKTVTGVISGVAGVVLGWVVAVQEFIPYLKTLVGLVD